MAEDAADGAAPAADEDDGRVDREFSAARAAWPRAPGRPPTAEEDLCALLQWILAVCAVLTLLLLAPLRWLAFGAAALALARPLCARAVRQLRGTARHAAAPDAAAGAKDV